MPGPLRSIPIWIQLNSVDRCDAQVLYAREIRTISRIRAHARLYDRRCDPGQDIRQGERA